MEDVKAQVRASRSSISEQARIDPTAVIVADELVVEDGAVVGPGCDLRSARVHLGAGASVGAGSQVLAADVFRLGEGTRLDAHAQVVCRELVVGAGTYLGPRLQVGAGASMEEESLVSIGDRCQIAPDVLINPTQPVRIGSDVGISPQVALWTHGYHSGHPVREGHAATFAGVEIGDGVWLGFRSTVLPGVRVGAGTVVAATATVTSSLPSQVLAAGVPARVKRALTAQSLAPDARAQAVEDLVHAWVERLRFKGMVVERTERGWNIDEGQGRAWSVSQQRALTSMVGILPTRPRLGAEVLFDFGEPLRVTGKLDELGHDLRDFCRRATWYFPYPINSTGLVPHRFARLMD
ncbi:hypothetical protein [Nocardiopsis synnemataformans]|uniref:acyltransferase n=1 Tax=Nocardiopsis synnemataformans TaxID=61305 RepID=UPI003EBDCB8C